VTPAQALTSGYRQVASRLGAHQLSCKSTLLSRIPGAPEKKVLQQMTLRLDQQGGYSAIKNTHPQYGHEVIWTGGWLYPRLRYGKFLRRKARPGEHQQIMDRMAGYLPAYARLLRPFMSVTVTGEAVHLGRKVKKLSLGLKPGAPQAPTSSKASNSSPPAPAQRWRQKIKAESITGAALLDRTTGALLSVDLTAQWQFVPPAASPLPASGIPVRLDTKKPGAMSLTFSQRITHLGQIPPIAPPPAEDILADVRRRRLELERQIFSGERPLPKSWRPVP